VLVVFDHGIIKTIENSTVSLANEKHKKLKRLVHLVKIARGGETVEN